VNSNSDLKICDFGLARANIQALQTHSLALTDYIATRWYRAPEVLLSWKNYSSAIDIWSVGCILAEMMVRAPLFPGHDQEEQIQMIVDLIGYPSQEEIESISSNSQGAKILQKIPPNEGKDFLEVFAGNNEEAIDLMRKML
jgi:mitogen-activated protein kinase 1/3